MKKYFSVVLILVLMYSLFTGCKISNSNDEIINSDNSSNDTYTTENTIDTIDVDFSQSDADMFTERDMKTGYDESDSIFIELKGTSASASSNSVKISGTTITITEDVTHIISGTLDDGMIIVNAPDTAKLQLVFDGVDINCETSAPIYILEADKVFITLAEGSENKLSNGGSFTAIDENNIDAVIFSKQDLTINGTGSLAVASPAGHGIVSKDDLVITGGTFTVDAASHGLDANDSVRIKDASIAIDAGKDGIHAENTDDVSLGFVYIESGEMKIKVQDDGISAGSYMQIKNGLFTIDSVDDAIHSDASININDGVFEITSGDDAIHAEEKLTVTAGTINITECYEGLEALNIDVQGGDITLVASDDGFNAAGGNDTSSIIGDGDEMRGNPSGMRGGLGETRGGPGRMRGGPGGMRSGMSSASNGSITISGGNLYIKASGDGLDANGTITISGGYIVVAGPTQGDTATLDYDVSSIITGGTFIGTGGAGMAQTFSNSEQGVIAVSVGNQSAGTNITLKDKSGNTIISYSPELSFAVVILSSSDIVSGDTYALTVGSISGEVEAS